MPELVERAQWRAVIYNRASADKTGQRVSVDSQDRENRAWCDREGWEIAATVTDNDRSATRFASRSREGYRSLLDGLTERRWGRVDVLVMWESSRGERRLDGHVELRALCERLRILLAYKGRVLDMADGDDRFTAGLDALLDEREAERARERTKRSHRASVEARTPRGSLPFGYRREYDPGNRRMVAQVPDSRTALVLQAMVADVLAGRTLYSIAQQLNRDGVATPQQERDRRQGRLVERAGWSSSMIRNLLGKPSLAGMRSHNGVTVGPGDWEPIVSPADWRAVQALLRCGSLRAAPGREVRYLLSGIAECGVCGAWLRPLTNNGRPTYVCAGKTPSSPKGHVSRLRGPLDGMVVVRVIGRLSDPGLAEEWVVRAAGEQNDAALRERQLADLEVELAQYVAAATDRKGRSLEAVLAIVDDLAAQIETKRAERAQVSRLPRAVLDLTGADAQAKWDSDEVQRDLPRQRLAIRTLLRVQVYRSSQRGARGFDESTIEITPL